VTLSLGLGLAMSWGAALLFGQLALRLVAKPVSVEEWRTATTMFAAWWGALSVSSFIAGLRVLLATSGAPLPLAVGLGFVGTAVGAMGLAALLYHLLVLLTGRDVPLAPLMLFYALFAGWAIEASSRWQPIGYEVRAWSVQIAYAQGLEGGERLLALLLYVGPQLMAGVGLLAIAHRLPRSAERVRTIVTASGILVWFGVTVGATALELAGPLWGLARHLLAIGVGLAVTLVHQPPTWLERRMPPEIAGGTLQRELA
jgi:hypothetical protein